MFVVRLFVFPLIVGLFFVFPVVSAEGAEEKLYKWVDDQGATHLTDDPSSIPENFRGKATVEKKAPLRPSGSLATTPVSQGGIKPIPSTELCPENMVYIDNYCIDIYEYPNKKGVLPTTNVNFFEAQKYCKEQGKRLCMREEWKKACRGPSDLIYPYGNSYREGWCNSWKKTGPNSLKPSGSFKECSSDYGVYDMAGNASEWAVISSKDEEKAGEEGDSFITNPVQACVGIYNLRKNVQTEYIGFRCCKDIDITVPRVKKIYREKTIEVDDFGHDESWWRDRIRRWKEEQIDAENKIKSLETQIQTEQSRFPASWRLTSLKERLENEKSRLSSAKKMIEEISEEARKAGAPPGWVR